MVVKLDFTDGSSVIKNYSNDQLWELGIYRRENLIEFFENKFGVGEIIDFDFVDSCEGSDTYQFDIRNYFKYADNLVGMEIDGKKIGSYSFPLENSYEYNVSLMGYNNIKDLYTKYVTFEVEDNEYDYYDGGDPYDDDGPSSFEY
jgi:hypothetical protein